MRFYVRSHQAHIRMRSHRLLRLDDSKSAAACKLIGKFDGSCFNNLQQVCKYQVSSSLTFILMQLVEANRLDPI